jgi:predicted peroxiredoxin
MDRIEKSIIFILPDAEVINFLKMFLEMHVSKGVAFVICPQKYSTVSDGEKLVVLTVEINTPSLSLLEKSIESGLLSVWKHFVAQAKDKQSYFSMDTEPSPL